MKKILHKVFTVLVFLSTILLISCNEEPTPSLNDLPAGNLPAPKITALNPAVQGLAGVTTITITGSNFSSNLKNDFVYFNGKPGTVLSATPTQLTVLAANVVSDVVLVKVAVLGADNFSNIYNFKLLSPWQEFYQFDKVAEKPTGVFLDNNDNLLVGLNSIGIWKITPDKVKSLYIPFGANVQKWLNFRYGPGGELYGVGTARGVWKLVENVKPASPWGLPPSGSTIKALEFDGSQNLWTLNTSNTIYKFKQDKTFTAYPFIGVLSAVRMFNNDLYVAATKDNIEGVWKIPILNGDLGTPELYFDITNIKIGAKITALAFSANGDLIIGTDKGPNPILVVKPDKSYSELYPGVIPANSVVSMFWPSTGTSLYFVRGEEVTVDASGKVTITVPQTVLRVEMEQNGAAYFGQ